MEEKEFRLKVSKIFSLVAAAFDKVDPDIAEAEVSQGTLTVVIPGKKKIVLSPQPPVQQMWLAVAAKAQALHFDWNIEKGAWIDDKGLGIELLSHIKETVAELSGADITF